MAPATSDTWKMASRNASSAGVYQVRMSDVMPGQEVADIMPRKNRKT